MPEELIKLSAHDADRYATLKQALRDGMTVCFVMGAALREIKEKAWFKADGYETWEAFMDGEYGWTRRYGDQLIIDAKMINSLPPSMRKLITSHAAAKELAKIPEMLRPAVVEQASSAKKGVNAASIKKHAPPPRKGDKPKPAAPPRKAAAKPDEKKPNFFDETGLEVPIECQELWKRDEEPRQILLWLNAIAGKMQRVQEEQDVLFVECDVQDNLAKLSQLVANIKLAKPHAVCPSCQGKLPKDCTTCKGRGFVSKFYWDTFVPEEIKNLRSKP